MNLPVSVIERIGITNVTKLPKSLDLTIITFYRKNKEPKIKLTTLQNYYWRS